MPQLVASESAEEFVVNNADHPSLREGDPQGRLSLLLPFPWPWLHNV